MPESPADGPPAPGGGTPEAPRRRRRLLVALVVSGRVAAEVDGLRRALQPSLIERLPPHITLVPPVNVDERAVPDALSLLRAAAAESPPLALELGPLGTFLPRTPVVYLACAGGSDELASLRQRLERPPLAAPASRPARPFVAHVTLAKAVDPARAPLIVSALAAFRATAEIDRLTLLEQDPLSRDHRWRPLADAVLGGRSVVGRGGFEIEIALSERLDEEASAFEHGEWDRYRTTREALDAKSERVAAVARAAGRPVGAVTALREREFLAVGCLVVASHLRRQGVGGQLIGFLERWARERGVQAIEVCVRSGTEAEAFYLARGFARAARAASAGEPGHGFCLLTRRLL